MECKVLVQEGKKAFERMECERMKMLRQQIQGEETFLFLPMFEQNVHKNVEDFRVELFSRLEQDISAIAEIFFAGEMPARISDITWDGADFHAHGRCALKIETDCGVFYYKPRISDMDALYCQIVRTWFSDITDVPQCLFRDGYSYVAEIRETGVESEQEVGEAYFHYGALLALFQALGSSDMHCENLIMRGTFPVVVDMETMLTPAICKKFGISGTYFQMEDEKAQKTFLNFMTTAMLPSVQIGGRQYSPLYLSDLQSKCLPLLQGCPIPITGYEEQFLSGYREGFYRIISVRDELMECLEAHRDVFFRYVMRPTAYYLRKLMRLLEPEALRDRERREEIFRQMNGRFVKSGVEDEVIRVLSQWERASMEEADFPYYYVRLDSHDLYGLPDQAPLIRGFFEQSALEQAKMRLERMNETYLRVDCDLIRACLWHPDVAHTWWEPRERAPREVPALQLTGDEIMRETDEIILNIERLMVRTPDGRSVWFAGHKGLEKAIGGAFVENGCAGIALFCWKYLACGGREKERAKKLMSLCHQETDKYLQAWRAWVDGWNEAQCAETKWQKGDRQYQAVEKMEAVCRILDGDISRLAELERQLFASGKEAADESTLETDIVANGRAGQAGWALVDHSENGDETMLTRAERLMTRAVAERRIRGAYRTRDYSFQNSLDPSFTYGESGIGYVLLLLKEAQEKTRG